jgi:hypothetical protein
MAHCFIQRREIQPEKQITLVSLWHYFESLSMFIRQKYTKRRVKLFLSLIEKAFKSLQEYQVY